MKRTDDILAFHALINADTEQVIQQNDKTVKKYYQETLVVLRNHLDPNYLKTLKTSHTMCMAYSSSETLVQIANTIK
ncbi:hypothetical protein GCM10020331_034360 [Ectobacillus funiculus]